MGQTLKDQLCKVRKKSNLGRASGIVRTLISMDLHRLPG